MPKNGFVIFSIEGVRTSQFLADALRFNLAMPTNRVYAFTTNAKPQKNVNKYLSRVEVCFKVDIQDISIGTQHFWLLNAGDACKVDK